MSCHNKRNDKPQKNEEIDNTHSKKVKLNKIFYFSVAVGQVDCFYDVLNILNVDEMDRQNNTEFLMDGDDDSFCCLRSNADEVCGQCA